MKLLLLTTLVISLFFGTTRLAHAKMYKWVDKNGNVHFSDRKPAAKSFKKKTVKTIKKRSSGSSVSSVDQRSAITYKKNTPPQSISLAPLKIDLAGANYQDIKVGHTYTGARCEERTGDLMWVSGNGFLDDARLDQVFISVFRDSGYKLVSTNAPLHLQPEGTLVLKTRVTKFRINQCHSTRKLGVSSDAYVKIKWALEDKLLHKTLFEGSSEGSYKGLSKQSRKNGTKQSIDRAIVIAANNALSQKNFVKQLSVSENNNIAQKNNNFDSLAVKIRYSDLQGSFKSNLKHLQKSTVTVRTTGGHGSGVFISNDGTILTNQHVVGNESKVLIIVDDKEYVASVVRIEPIRDVAILKIPRYKHKTPLAFAKEPPGVGDTIFVIGTPLSEELSHTVTSGIISAKRTKNGLPLLQTDASINPGNSGGPIFNEFGELVAISVSGIFSKTGAGLGLNYIIPIDDALSSLNIDFGTAKNKNFLKHSKTNKTIKKVKRKQTKALKKRKSLDKKLTSDQLFNAYTRALDAKKRGQLNTAKGILRSAVSSIPKKDQSNDAKQVKDELYIHLPLAYAIEAIRKKQPNRVEKYLKPVTTYLVTHPDRFKHIKTISRIRDSLKYLEQAVVRTSSANTQQIKMILREEFNAMSKLPNSASDIDDLLRNRLGSEYSNHYTVDSFNLNSKSYKLVLKELYTSKTSVIKGRLL